MGRLSQTFKICLALLFAVLSSNLLPVYASALAAPDPLDPTQKVDICHSAGQSGEYTVNDIDTSAIDEINNPDDNNGHGAHANDIIPPFTSSPDGVVYPGKNWNATTQAIYLNDCDIPEVQPQYYLQTSANLETCGEITISLRNVSPWMYRVLIEEKVGDSWVRVAADAGNEWMVVPGVMEVSNFGDAPDDQTGTYTVRYTEDSGTKEVRYRVSSGTESDLYAGAIGQFTYESVGTNCEADLPPVELVVCKTFPRIEATNLNLNGWTLGENASFVDGGMKLDVTGGWDTTTITRTLSGELKDLGTGIDFAPEDRYLGLHVKTSIGTLSYEKFYENQDPANTGKWWSNSNFGVASGQGYATFDTLENIVAANPGVTLENLRVLYTHPNPSSVVVTSVKIGCNEYTFDYERLVQACTVRDNTYRDTWMFDGFTYPEADDYSGVVNNATFQFTNEGLHISTPDKPSYVFGLIDGGKTPLADVDAMSYKTFRKDMSAGYEQTLPAYILYVDTNGDAPNGETYFFYEPYNNGEVVEGTWQTWDAINSGNAKWWMSGTGQKLQTWSYFVGQFPDAVVLAYGFNQGTSNAETYAIIQDMKFDCAITNFAAPQVLGEETSNPTPTGPTVIVPTTGAVLPAQLPATGGGSDTNYTLLGIVLSAAAYYFAYRRQSAEA